MKKTSRKPTAIQQRIDKLYGRMGYAFGRWGAPAGEGQGNGTAYESAVLSEDQANVKKV